MKNFFTLHFLVVFILGLKSVDSSAQSAYFRSVQSGPWDALNTWESSSDGLSNWIAATAAPTSNANSVTIRAGHNVRIINSVSVDEVVVASGGVLELATGVSSLLTVNDGTGSDIVVQKGGVFKHNIASNASLPSFNGSATLEIQQAGTLEIVNNYGNPSNYANIASVTSTHVVFDDGAVFNWNNSSNPTEGITYFPASAPIPVFRISQAVTIGGTSPTIINGLLEANANVSFQSNQSKTFRNGIIGTGKVGVTALNGGQFIINGTTAKLGGSGVLDLNNKGLLIAAGSIVTMTSNKTINNYFNGTNTSTGTITNSGTLAAGDYVISGNSKIQIDGSLTTTNVNGLSGGMSTTFATVSGFTLQTPGSSSTVEYNGNTNQIVTPLLYNSLIISGAGIKTAGDGTDVSVSGSLSILTSSTFALNGTNHLKLNGGGILNINPNATFDNGGESQVSGGGTPVVNIYGTFITRDAQGFTGTNTAIPGATVNIFDGSTIEYGRLGDQTVTSRTDYKNLMFSGSGTKTLPTCRPIGTVTIKDNVTVDASNKTFGDTTACNLVMTGGRFRVGGTGTKPDIAGTYILTGGVIEFTNSGATKQTIRSSPTYFNIEITGTNIGNSVSSTKLGNGGSFTIKTGAVYDNNADDIDGSPLGIESFILEAGATFKTGVKGGFFGNDSAAVQNIEKIIVDPKSTIIYRRAGNQTITPLDGAHPSLLLKGSGTKTLASGTLTISATADSIVVDPLIILKVNTGAKVDFNGRPVFVRCSSAGSGTIGEIGDGTSGMINATNVTVERFIPARRAFRFLSPSVTTGTSIKANWMEGVVNPDIVSRINPNPGYGTNITGKNCSLNGFDPTKTDNPSLFTFSTPDQKWIPVPNTNGTLNAGNGYRIMVRGDRSIDMSQYDNNPTPTNTILRTNGTIYTGTYLPALSTVYNSFSFIGNPYASPVDFLQMIKMNAAFQVTGTAHNIKPEYTIWDPNLSRRGAYVTFNAATGKSNDTSDISQYVQPGQAFFVQTTGADPKIQFDEINKATEQTRVFRDPSLKTKLSVQLLLSSDEGKHNNADGVVAFFDEAFSNSIGNEDSYKFKKC